MVIRVVMDKIAMDIKIELVVAVEVAQARPKTVRMGMSMQMFPARRDMV